MSMWPFGALAKEALLLWRWAVFGTAMKPNAKCACSVKMCARRGLVVKRKEELKT